MELVFSRPRGDADDGAGGLAVLGAIRVGEHLEFGDGVNRGKDKDGTVGTDVVVVDAVHQEQVVRTRIAVDREVRAALQTLTPRLESVVGGNTGLQLRQFHKIAPVQGKLANLCAFDNRADISGSRLYLNVARFDRNYLIGGAQFEFRGHFGGGRNVNFHVPGQELFEAARLDGHLVNTDVNGWKRKRSQLGRRGLGARVGADIAETDHGADNRRARRIHYSAANRSRIVLSMSCKW